MPANPIPRRFHAVVYSWVVIACGLATAASASDPAALKSRLQKRPATAAALQLDNSRYPWRIPDWLWRDQRRSATLPVALRKELEADVKILAVLDTLEDRAAYDAKEDELARKLGTALSLRDLTAGVEPIADLGQRLCLAVQLDPAFDAKSAETLRAAAGQFLRVALEPGVVRAAFDSSVDQPTPVPEMYVLKDGQPATDEFGLKVYTDEYKFFLSQRARPRTAEAFTTHLRSALSTPNGDPALLAVSRYTGNVWWGGGFYDFLSSPAQQLTRLSPPQGYTYVRINADKLKPGVDGWDDPSAWAGKLAHELLHNLGYWHPNYKDPADRDANNQGDRQAFIVAYERAVTAAARKPPK